MVDADYRGNVGVVLFNLSQKPYEGVNTVQPSISYIISMVTVKRGDRIAQLVLEKIMTPTVMETEVRGQFGPYAIAVWCVVQELPDSQRGSGGFGSTGL